MELMLVSVIFFVAAVVLLLHHGWKHARDDPETSRAQQESCPEVCYFQPSDVFNFKTYNHETWIIICFSISWYCWWWSVIPWVRVHSASEVCSMMVNVFCIFMVSVVCMLYVCVNI